jgi:hypothetical protein
MLGPYLTDLREVDAERLPPQEVLDLEEGTGGSDPAHAQDPGNAGMDWQTFEPGFSTDVLGGWRNAALWETAQMWLGH